MAKVSQDWIRGYAQAYEHMITALDLTMRNPALEEHDKLYVSALRQGFIEMRGRILKTADKAN